MAKTREERLPLEEKLTALIKKLNSDDKIYDKIVDELKDKMTEGSIAALWGSNKPLSFLNDNDLLLFTQAFYKATYLREIDPKKYFTENEFNQSLHTLIIPKLSSNSITFENVSRCYDEDFDSYMYIIPDVSCYKIVESMDNAIVNYNFNLQREAIKKIVMDEEILLPKLFDDAIEEIPELIINGSYVPDIITWNVLKTGLEDIRYEEETRRLTLVKTEGSSIDLIDGNNRSHAIQIAVMKANERGIKIKKKIGLRITNFTLKQAYSFITQINKQHPLSKERSELLEETKFIKLAKNINTFDNSETNMLYKKLGESISELKTLNIFSTIQIIAKGFEENFKDELNSKPSVLTDMTEYIVDFFNEFLSRFYDEYDRLKDTHQIKKETVLFDSNMFIFYIYIAKKLYHLRNKTRVWRSKVKEIASEIDFNKSNSDWDTMKTTGQLNKKAKQELINYFDSKIDKILNESENDIVVTNS